MLNHSHFWMARNRISCVVWDKPRNHPCEVCAQFHEFLGCKLRMTGDGRPTVAGPFLYHGDHRIFDGTDRLRMDFPRVFSGDWGASRHPPVDAHGTASCPRQWPMDTLLDKREQIQRRNSKWEKWMNVMWMWHPCNLICFFSTPWMWFLMPGFNLTGDSHRS